MARCPTRGVLVFAAALAGCLDAPPASVTGSGSDASTRDGAVGGDGAVDGDATGCPGQCDSCDEVGACIINCGEGECTEPIECPPGRACAVTCTGYTACEDTPIDCRAATNCNITCQGHDACQAGIQCAGDLCYVDCSGTDACSDGTIDCAAVDCAIRCDGENACSGGVCCDGSDCGGECAGGGCCTCGGC